MGLESARGLGYFTDSFFLPTEESTTTNGIAFRGTAFAVIWLYSFLGSAAFGSDGRSGARCSSELGLVASAESKTSLLERLHVGDPAKWAAREKLVRESEIVDVDDGAMGITFALRDPKSGVVTRYKYPLPPEDPKIWPLLEKRFLMEAAIAREAGDAGIAPKASIDPRTGLLRMEEIDGTRLDDFRSGELAAMSEADREEWLDNFLVTMGHHLQTLHALGISHLDLKPANVILPKAHDHGRRVLLIDFGISLRHSDLPRMYAVKQGRPYAGTPAYQGKGSVHGKPSPDDDLDSLRILFIELLPGKSADSYLSERPMLRALLALFSEPPANFDPARPDASARMLALATRASSSRREREEFWSRFTEALATRTPGQKLKVLFASGAPAVDEGVLESYEPDALKKMIDDGAAENGWRYLPASEAYEKSESPENEPWGVPARVLPIDLARLKTIREALGPIPYTSGASQFRRVLDQLKHLLE